jgi:ATP-binding cassette, subfamily B, bacterial
VIGPTPDLRWALAYIRPHRRRLALVLVLSLASTLLALVLPYLSKQLVDDALLGRDRVALLRIVLLFTAITLASFGLNVVAGLRYTRVSADILFRMRLDLYRHLQRLSPRFYARMPLGQIVSRLNTDIGEVQRVAAETILAWVGSAITLVGTVIMLAWLDLRLFLVSLVFLPPAVAALVRYRQRLEGAVAATRERSADMGSFLIDTLQGNRVVAASNAAAREADRFRGKNDAFVGALMALRRLSYLAGGLPGILVSLGTTAVFLYGGWRVIGGTLTLGTFVAFIAYQMRLLAPVQAMMGIYAAIASARVSLRRVQEILDTPPEVVEAERPVVLTTPGGEVRFEGVSFTHDRGGPVLDAVDFVVRPGERLAIVGPSGSGKSTIADLLLRLVDPAAGRITLDGQDLRTLRLADLRRHVAVVEGEPHVFHASIEENIRYARPDATAAEVDEAARRAGLHDLLASLPDGLGTIVGERGRALSAGERQRLAIARAFLADPTVLVLDEATASLDPGVEAHVVSGYEAVMRGRTTILISHRLDLARRADRVLVLERGQLVEEGEPQELLARRSAFRDLFAPSLASAG